MLSSLFYSALILGLAGAPHCLGMCGGIHFSAQTQSPHTLYWLHAGRISSYMILGVVVASLGYTLHQLFSDVAPITRWIYFCAGLLMMYYGLRLIRPASAIAIGQTVANQLHFKLTRITPRQPIQQHAYVRGLLWGVIPCGLTYSAVLLTPASLHPLWGGAVMAVFGIATLPTFLMAGGIFRILRQKKWARLVLGLLMIGLGLMACIHSFANSHQHPVHASSQ